MSNSVVVPREYVEEGAKALDFWCPNTVYAANLRKALSAAPQPADLRERDRFAREQAEALLRCADEADDNNWQDWAVTMRQASDALTSLLQPSPVEQKDG